MAPASSMAGSGGVSDGHSPGPPAAPASDMAGASAPSTSAADPELPYVATGPTADNGTCSHDDYGSIYGKGYHIRIGQT